MSIIKPELNDIKEAFLAAMANGYASQPAVLPGPFPGSAMTTHNHGDFRVVNIWFATPYSDMSEGFTFISISDSSPDRLVWMMSYRGWYRPDVIPFLKECLRVTYVTKPMFIGGRGPNRKVTGALKYENTPYGSFARFSGRESIHDGKIFAGHHWYRGGSMLENDTMADSLTY